MPEQISRDRQYIEKINLQIEETRSEIRLDYMASGEKSVIEGRLDDLAKSEKELMKTFELIVKRHIK